MMTSHQAAERLLSVNNITLNCRGLQREGFQQ